MKNEWYLITIGHLTRNIFWGESSGKAVHSCIAACTAVRSEYGVILIDPSLPAELLMKELYDQTGIRPEEVTYIYCTHNHLDHWTGTEAFPHAKLCLPEADLWYLKEDRDLYDGVRGTEIDRMIGVCGELVPGFCLVSLPGHSLGLSGLLFDGPEGKILAAGDSVMGKEYFHAKRGYFWSADLPLSCKSMEKAAALADYIIPGHGNYFNVAAYLYEEGTPDEVIPEAVPGIISEYSPLKEVIYNEDCFEVFHRYLPGMNIAGLRIARDVSLHALILNMDDAVQKDCSELLRELNECKNKKGK